MLKFPFRFLSALLKLFGRIALILGGAVLYSFGQMAWAFINGDIDLNTEKSTNSPRYLNDARRLLWLGHLEDDI